MTRYLLPVLVLGICTLGCHNSPDSVKAADTANFHRSDSLQKTASVIDSASVPSKQDGDFMVKAASGGMLEVELGKLAMDKGVSPRVKFFGQMMVQDHGQVAEQIKRLAAAKRIILPDSVSNAEKKNRDELDKKAGHGFDRDYINMMIDDHKEDIKEFKKESQNANDSDIKVFAGNMLPILQKHLDSIESIHQAIH